MFNIGRLNLITLLEKIHKIPKKIINFYKEEIQRPSKNIKFDKLISKLEKLFSKYNTNNLSIDAKEFEDNLIARINKDNYIQEGYSEDELDLQRDLSIRFTWGHNHNFGAFKIKGRMLNRHIILMSNFLGIFNITFDEFKDKKVLDVGCWTGGTSLLLAALGSKVTAIEEVKKYADTTDYLARSFGLQEQIKALPISLYELNQEIYKNKFEIVYFPGVIYHISDPVLGLRILFNTLTLGGSIFVETAGLNSNKSICKYEGSSIFHDIKHESKEKKNRGGWNWFCPSPIALKRMMIEAGFEEVKVSMIENRVYAYGVKKSIKSICRAGLALKDID